MLHGSLVCYDTILTYQTIITRHGREDTYALAGRMDSTCEGG